MKKNNVASSTLEEIKRQFDPGFSYVVFERAGPAEKSRFRVVLEVLNRLDLPVLELRTFYDQVEEKMLLVAKFDVELTDGIMEAIIGAGLPRDVVFYGYGSSRPARDQEV